MRSFLESNETALTFFYCPHRALSYARKKQGSCAIWANRATPRLRQKASVMGVPLLIVEDGFIRSIGLGSGFLPPCSIIVDTQGPYVDPAHPSDLEDLLSHAVISPALQARTRALIDTLKRLHISKYAATASDLSSLQKPTDRPSILVPGQVGGDLSVIRGGGSITDNLALLKDVRHRNPHAWIIYRPHPDVEAGHRRGSYPDSVILRYADAIQREGSMSALLDVVDEVHTLTSLAGFEALIRGKRVTTYGGPFYAGWGLTTHLGPPLPRRQRMLEIIDLVAVTLILYPLYINPETEQRCEIEELITCFGKAELWVPTLAMRVRRKQGQLRRSFSRFISSYRTPHA